MIECHQYIELPSLWSEKNNPISTFFTKGDIELEKFLTEVSLIHVVFSRVNPSRTINPRFSKHAITKLRVQV